MLTQVHWFGSGSTYGTIQQGIIWIWAGARANCNLTNVPRNSAVALAIQHSFWNFICRNSYCTATRWMLQIAPSRLHCLPQHMDPLSPQEQLNLHRKMHVSHVTQEVAWNPGNWRKKKKNMHKNIIAKAFNFLLYVRGLEKKCFPTYSEGNLIAAYYRLALVECPEPFAPQKVTQSTDVRYVPRLAGLNQWRQGSSLCYKRCRTTCYCLLPLTGGNHPAWVCLYVFGDVEPRCAPYFCCGGVGGGLPYLGKQQELCLP